MPSSHRLFRGNLTLDGQRNTPAITIHQCDADGVVWKGENNAFYANLMLFWTNLWWAFHVRQATPVELIPILFISFAIEGLTMQKIKGLAVRGERASATRVRPILQHPASSLIVHPSSLWVVSHALPPLDTHQSATDTLLYLTTNRPHWLPLCDRQSRLCFHSTIRFYLGRSSRISAKTTPLTDSFDGETRQKQSSTAHQTSSQSQLALGMAMQQ